jgi:hypothetical protein
MESDMKPFIYGKWHIWEVTDTGKLMLSNEDLKNLYQFDGLDECINWLYLSDNKDAARALNAHVKGV